MHSGITYLGKHSYKNFGITLANGREIGIPNKKKSKQTLPFSNVVYDYSELFGSQAYEERRIKYTFNIAGREIRTKEEMNWVKTSLLNWLMVSGGKQPLYDDFFPGYYFLAEVEGNSNFIENWSYGFLEVNFTAYPFMISELREGHDIWDDFNFLFDTTQDTSFEVPGSKGVYTQLDIGSKANIAAWATSTLGGTTGDLERYRGLGHTILSRSDTYVRSSSRTYMLKGIEYPVAEEDIVEACTNYIDISLYNMGASSVSPEIKSTRSDGGEARVSVKNLNTGNAYTLLGVEPVDHLFQLASGENRLRLCSEEDHTLDFTFYKELI